MRALRQPTSLGCACAGRVVLEIVSVDIGLLEELDCNAVVVALAEVHLILEVAVAGVQAKRRARGAPRT